MFLLVFHSAQGAGCQKNFRFSRWLRDHFATIRGAMLQLLDGKNPPCVSRAGERRLSPQLYNGPEAVPSSGGAPPVMEPSLHPSPYPIMMGRAIFPFLDPVRCKASPFARRGLTASTCNDPMATEVQLEEKLLGFPRRLCLGHSSGWVVGLRDRPPRKVAPHERGLFVASPTGSSGQSPASVPEFPFGPRRELRTLGPPGGCFPLPPRSTLSSSAAW